MEDLEVTHLDTTEHVNRVVYERPKCWNGLTSLLLPIGYNLHQWVSQAESVFPKLYWNYEAGFPEGLIERLRACPIEIREKVYGFLTASWDPNHQHPHHVPSYQDEVAIARYVPLKTAQTTFPKTEDQWVVYEKTLPRQYSRGAMIQEASFHYKYRYLDYLKRSEYHHLAYFVETLEKYELGKLGYWSDSKEDRWFALEGSEFGFVSDVMDWYWKSTVLDLNASPEILTRYETSLFFLDRLVTPFQIQFIQHLSIGLYAYSTLSYQSTQQFKRHIDRVNGFPHLTTVFYRPTIDRDVMTGFCDTLQYFIDHGTLRTLIVWVKAKVTDFDEMAAEPTKQRWCKQIRKLEGLEKFDLFLGKYGRHYWSENLPLDWDGVAYQSVLKEFCLPFPLRNIDQEDLNLDLLFGDFIV